MPSTVGRIAAATSGAAVAVIVIAPAKVSVTNRSTVAGAPFALLM